MTQSKLNDNTRFVKIMLSNWKQGSEKCLVIVIRIRKLSPSTGKRLLHLNDTELTLDRTNMDLAKYNNNNL
jgi:hypothetical protein